jgi:hypothetical protein
VRVSPSSSDLAGSSAHRLARRAASLALAALVAALAAAPGCVTVRPEEREFLAAPAMTFGSEGEAGAHEAHVLSNREGSFGAAGVTGGGCGCN